MHAADRGHTEAVRALLAAPGVDVNAADFEGSTALSCWRRIEATPRRSRRCWLRLPST